MIRVLVVDDDTATRELLEDVLEDEGYAVELASNGAAALEVLPAAPPDIVLLDLSMPIMDGFAFVRACRGDPRWTNLRIVLLTGHQERGGSAAGVAAYLPKPFDLGDLLDTLRVVACGQTDGPTD